MGYQACVGGGTPPPGFRAICGIFPQCPSKRGFLSTLGPGPVAWGQSQGRAHASQMVWGGGPALQSTQGKEKAVLKRGTPQGMVGLSRAAPVVVQVPISTQPWGE